ncbi:MAG: hypothetical protein K0Q95_2209 [Bacteroidota bacterium]|nr:hypothetical protein [Bacteroidota bacterium]
MDISDGFLIKTEQGKANKYFVGLAIIWTPFFLLAHVLSKLAGIPADGYSYLYHVFVLLAANIFLWLGCRYTLRLISEYSPSRIINSGVVLLIVFGTNLFFYTTYDSVLTHVYSFGIISAFLYYSRAVILTANKKNLYCAALLFGLIILLRPTNAIIILMLPFFAGSFRRFTDSLRQLHARDYFISAILFLSVLVTQFILYYLQTGHIIVWSYGEERFYFGSPQIYNVLFSYRKGLFVYTPLFIIALTGLIYLFRTNRFQFIMVSSFLIANTYVISCWWCWWYSGSLGQRAFVDSYSVLALLLVFLILGIRKKSLRILVCIPIITIVAYSLVLTYQYKNHILDYANMNEKKFWFTFMKTSPDLEGIAGCDVFFEGASSDIVSIRALSSNKYLSAARDDNKKIEGTRDQTRSWESFNLISIDDKKVAFRCDDGNYFSVRLDLNSILTHQGTQVKEWEQFELIRQSNEVVIIKACNNKFLVREGQYFFAQQTTPERAEKFLIKRK